jgi:hypothetical protein
VTVGGRIFLTAEDAEGAEGRLWMANVKFKILEGCAG